MLALLLATALTILGRASAAAPAITPDEQRVLDALDAGRALADMQLIAASAAGIAQGVGEGSVVAGSPEETALAETIARRFRELGLATRIETFPVRAYRYTVPRLHIDGEPLAAIALHAAGAVSGRRDGVPFARGNEAGGTRLRATLVHVGDGYAADYARAGDVRGKAVLVRREQRDWPPLQVTEAAQHGAAAIVFYDHPSSGDRVDALRQDSLWAHEQLPAVAISIASGRALREKLAKSAVEITLESAVDVRDGQSRNVVGVLQGSENPDQWVMTSAHYDRWFRGGLDNVSGTAALLEVARAVTQAGLRPRRSLMFLAVGAEEAGLVDPERDWLAGSHAFLLAHPEVFRHAALVYNVDGFGWRAKEVRLFSTPDVQAAQRGVLEDLGLAQAVAQQPHTVSAIDAWNYGVLGGAATNHLFSMDEGYFAIYHTQEDVVLPERFTNLGRDLSLLALALARAATAPRQTAALTALADHVGERFAADAARLAGVRFDELNAALADFRDAAAAVESDHVAGLRGEDADRLLMVVRHELVPWLYAVDGDFTQVTRTGEYANRVAALDKALERLRADGPTGALEALAVLYEGRVCARLSARAYAFERNFWSGEGGWSSRFGHRAPPPLPAFDTACRALRDRGADHEIVAGLEAARSEALLAAANAVALVAAKLCAATLALREPRG
ncbi:MAG: M28 family peptidase [Gammaproteobacteria bacterium]|nr:M28 family peptidase [Gammaproteobacteria bacterium]